MILWLTAVAAQVDREHADGVTSVVAHWRATTCWHCCCSASLGSPSAENVNSTMFRPLMGVSSPSGMVCVILSVRSCRLVHGPTTWPETPYVVLGRLAPGRAVSSFGQGWIRLLLLNQITAVTSPQRQLRVTAAMPLNIPEVVVHAAVVIVNVLWNHPCSMQSLVVRRSLWII